MRPEPELPARRAIIDVGSSTVKFAVYAFDGLQPRVLIESDDVVTDLGRGLAVGGCLAPSARRATLDALRSFLVEIESADAELMLVAATEAVRRAKDREDFLADLRALVPNHTSVRCLEGDEEAEWALRSALASLDLPERPVLSIDPGGSSNDAAWLGGRTLQDPSGLARVSLPFGMNQLMRLAPPENDEGRLGDEDIRRLSEFIRGQYDDLAKQTGPCERLVATSGAILALATADAELPAGSRQERATTTHGRRISLDRIRAMIEETSGMSSEERRLRHPSLSRVRSGIFVHGALVYRELLEAYDLDEVTLNAWGMKLGGVLGEA